MTTQKNIMLYFASGHMEESPFIPLQAIMNII
jgi:hypothetical protein